jgi:anti-sigma factor RsiW|tara:strand:- start:576 stop:770 length:195 start_codon:yes stop_codon:yes gene_type:complete
MTKPKFTDEQLMMFADGELNNRELSMDIISALIDGDKELQARLDVFVKTRSALLNSLLTKEKDI